MLFLLPLFCLWHCRWCRSVDVFGRPSLPRSKVVACVVCGEQRHCRQQDDDLFSRRPREISQNPKPKVGKPPRVENPAAVVPHENPNAKNRSKRCACCLITSKNKINQIAKYKIKTTLTYFVLKVYSTHHILST